MNLSKGLGVIKPVEGLTAEYGAHRAVAKRNLLCGASTKDDGQPAVFESRSSRCSHLLQRFNRSDTQPSARQQFRQNPCPGAEVAHAIPRSETGSHHDFVDCLDRVPGAVARIVPRALSEKHCLVLQENRFHLGTRWGLMPQPKSLAHARSPRGSTILLCRRCRKCEARLV